MTHSAVQSLFLAATLLGAAFVGTAQYAASGVQSAPATRSGKKASPPPPPGEPVSEADYAGGDACLTCHDIEAAFKKNPHYKAWQETEKPWSERGCETCHGPGKDHVESGGDITKIFDFHKASPQKISDTCLGCHLKQHEEQVNFQASEHGLNLVACTECHSVHESQTEQGLLKARVPAVCYDCHGEVRMEFNKPFHHKVHEGLMSCTDCHNPHGGFNPRQLRSANSNDAACFKCHAEKQGPFVFEHAPVRLEGCTLCHTPHGSVNARLLKRSQVNQLCLECHTPTPGIRVSGMPSFHSQTSPVFVNCTSCHVNIHGSNINKVFFE